MRPLKPDKGNPTVPNEPIPPPPPRPSKSSSQSTTKSEAEGAEKNAEEKAKTSCKFVWTYLVGMCQGRAVSTSAFVGKDKEDWSLPGLSERTTRPSGKAQIKSETKVVMHHLLGQLHPSRTARKPPTSTSATSATSTLNVRIGGGPIPARSSIGIEHGTSWRMLGRCSTTLRALKAKEDEARLEFERVVKKLRLCED